MTKLKQRGNSCNVLYSRVNNLWIKGIQFLTSRGVLFMRIWGKSKFHKMLEEVMQEQGMVN